MSHVFISYKHDDAHFVDSLREKLKTAGIETWVDSDIDPGEEWKAKIDEAIQSSFAVIVVVTPESHRSPYVTYEWSYAMDLNITAVPILLRDTKMHPKLVPLQYADFRYGKYGYERLVRNIINLQNAFKPPTKRFESSQEWDAQQIKRIIGDLKEDNPVIREAAILTLGNLQTDVAIDEIFDLLRDGRASVRASALKSLRLI